VGGPFTVIAIAPYRRSFETANPLGLQAFSGNYGRCHVVAGGKPLVRFVNGFVNETETREIESNQM
jgi:hypothetical protein